MNDHRCGEFVKYIAEDQLKIVLKSVASVLFFSIRLDSSADVRYAPKKSVRTFSVLTGTSSVLWRVLQGVLLSVLTVQYD